MKRFIKRYFDFSLPRWNKLGLRFYFRPWKSFYCYVWPQRCTHNSVLKPGVWVVTHTDYYWLNMILIHDHRNQINDYAAS
ncbi:hypothetical protein BEN47_16770 [Hymenobacter lapidarius]|uniref:Uncharacterized protein n=1 Tax=Hymenobacter lapidarius TaxID=1908237 RepID=A0A1G1SZS6_9BACT|nr:hypothetical protein [Hymenobacter lapidarius]OGX84130.1 hypothetical protein BEN47_16770 [Hymenobacter lapidarius]